MIIYTDSDLFESPAKVLVNTVNTRGVMGRGVALRFKKVYPEMFKLYQQHCQHRRLTIGRLFLYKTPHKWILNFPTKQHWRGPSCLGFIEDGLRKFRSSYADIGAPSYSFPKLGCGNGGLDFQEQVRPLMEQYLAGLSTFVRIDVGQDHIGAPRSLDTDRVDAWLRSEPFAPSFDAAWHDLTEALKDPCEFITWKRSSKFRVHCQFDPPEILVFVSDKPKIRIVKNVLVDFWQQLRSHGLTHSRIAPNHRHLSYLMPVFERLDYVQRVSVSESASRLKSNPRVALQLAPLPIHNTPLPLDPTGGSEIATEV